MSISEIAPPATPEPVPEPTPEAAVSDSVPTPTLSEVRNNPEISQALLLLAELNRDRKTELNRDRKTRVLTDEELAEIEEIYEKYPYTKPRSITVDEALGDYIYLCHLIQQCGQEMDAKTRGQAEDMLKFYSEIIESQTPTLP